MKTVTITAEQYNDLLYTACATANAKDVAALRLTNKVLDKLEAVGKQVEGSVGFALVGESAVIAFEDTEADFVFTKLEEILPKLQGWAARKALPLLDQLKEEAASKPTIVSDD